MKKILIFIFIEVVMTFLICHLGMGLNYVNQSQRLEPAATSYLVDNVVLSQKIKFRDEIKVKEIYLPFLNLNLDLDNNENIIICVNQEGKEVFRKNFNLKDDLKRTGWQHLKLLDLNIDGSKSFEFQLKAQNVKPKHFSVLLSNSNSQFYVDNVSVNNEVKEDRFLMIEINGYNYNNYQSKLLNSFLLLNFILIFGFLLFKGFKHCPITCVSFIVILFFILKTNFLQSLNINAWILNTWVIDYRYGFINRGFIGSLFSLFLLLYNQTTVFDVSLLHNVIAFSTIFVCLMSIVFIYYIEKNLKKCMVPNTLLLLWIFSPFFVVYFMGADCTFGRIDLFLFLIFILISFAILKFDNLIAVLILSIIGCLIYPAFIFIYFPTIFLLMVYKCYRCVNVMNITCTLLTVIFMVMLTLYFRYFDTLQNVIPMENYYSNTMNRIQGYNKFIHPDLLNAYTYNLNLRQWIVDIYKNHLHIKLLLLAIFSSVMISYVFVFWYTLVKSIKNIFIKCYFVLFLLSPLVIVVSLNTASDYVKFLVGIFTCYLVSPMLLVILERDNNNSIFSEILNRIDKLFGPHLINLQIFIFVFTHFTWSCWPDTEVSNVIVKWLLKIF